MCRRFQVVREYQVFQSMTGEEEASRSGNRPRWSCIPEGREEERHRHTGEHVRRGQSHEAGGRVVEWCLRVDAGAVRKLDGQQREERATIVTGACHAASSTEGAWHLSRLVGVREVVDQSGDLTFPTPGDGRLGDRPMVQEGRGRTQRKHELRRQMDDDTAQFLVVRAKRAPSASTLDELDDHLAAGHAEYRGRCPLGTSLTKHGVVMAWFLLELLDAVICCTQNSRVSEPGTKITLHTATMLR